MSRKLIWLMCGLMAGGLATDIALAEPGDGGGKEKRSPEERFSRMDADGDGKVTLEEFSAAHAKRMEKMKERESDRPQGDRTPPPAEEIFARMDANSDGSITLEEFTEHGEKRRAEMKEKKKGQKPGAE